MSGKDSFLEDEQKNIEKSGDFRFIQQPALICRDDW